MPYLNRRVDKILKTVNNVIVSKNQIINLKDLIIYINNPHNSNKDIIESFFIKYTKQKLF